MAAVQLSDEHEFGAGMFWAPFQDEALEHRWLRSIVEDALALYVDGAERQNGEPTT